MSRPDEGLIHQWLDGECTPEESARIEHLVATDAEWAAAVAEARGLIAASSRIIGALDAVPRAMPAGSVAAPTATTSGTASRRRLKLPTWIGVAAGVVLVAGTAYVMREQAAAPFGVVTAPSAQLAEFDTATGVQVTRDPQAIVSPQTVPTIGPVSPAASAGVASGAPTVAAPSLAAPSPAAPLPQARPSAPPPSALPMASVVDAAAAAQRKEAEDVAARRAAALSVEQERARATERQRLMRAVDAPRGAVARAAEPTVAETSASLPRLDGCWRVSAPPEFVGVLEAPLIRRTSGDSLVLVTPRGEVSVLREGDELRGGLRATRESCETPPALRVPR